MEGQWTKGPWHWDSDPVKGDPLSRVRYRVAATGKTITQTYYSSSDPQAEWDARLIAQAPAMAEALEVVRDYIDDNHTCAAMLDAILAAIKGDARERRSEREDQP